MGKKNSGSSKMHVYNQRHHLDRKTSDCAPLSGGGSRRAEMQATGDCSARRRRAAEPDQNRQLSAAPQLTAVHLAARETGRRPPHRPVRRRPAIGPRTCSRVWRTARTHRGADKLGNMHIKNGTIDCRSTSRWRTDASDQQTGSQELPLRPEDGGQTCRTSNGQLSANLAMRATRSRLKGDSLSNVT